jgi:hypothetical protein
MSVTPSLSWREEIPVGEAEAHEALAARLVALQRKRAETRTLGRALHYRSFGDPVGIFEVLPGLPGWAQVGIFASPGRFDALARFSSGNGEGAFPIIALHLWNLMRSIWMVLGRLHLVSRRRVYPKLDDFLSAANGMNVFRWTFAVHDAATCIDPLHTAVFDYG